MPLGVSLGTGRGRGGPVTHGDGAEEVHRVQLPRGGLQQTRPRRLHPRRRGQDPLRW